MDEFLNKPLVKNLILSILVLIIGGICSSLGAWNINDDSAFIFKFIFLIISSIIYITFLAYYSTKETNLNKVNRLLLHQVEAFEAVMVGIIAICKQSATDINTTIHNITSDGKINLQIWSFDKASNWVCREIYSILCKLHGKNKDFGVGYVRLIEDSQQEYNIYMSAYANQNMQKPTIFGKRRNINDEYCYHDAELFKENKADIEVIIGHDKIHDTFSYTKKSSQKKNKNKYNQYIAIPVFCNDSKMVGLLEIVCLNNTKLAETEEELIEIAEKYFMTYSHFLLLLHKLEKALLAQPENQN